MRTAPRPVHGESKPHEGLVSDLKKLGFTEYEARTFLTLLEEEPATAYEIGKRGNLLRANVYVALDALERRGAVQAISTNPARYTAVDPRILLDVIGRRTVSLCADITQRLERLVPQKKQDHVWLLEGQADIHRRIGDIIERAKRHIWIKAHEALLERHLPSLRDAVARGVQVLLVIFGGPDPEARFNLGPSARIYLHEGNGVVVGLGNSLLTLTADFTVALVANMDDRGHGAMAQNALVVNLAESLLRHEIYLAEIFACHGTQIDERFGPYLHSLRTKYFPSEQARILESMIAGQSTKVAGIPEAEGHSAQPSPVSQMKPRGQNNG